MTESPVAEIMTLGSERPQHAADVMAGVGGDDSRGASGGRPFPTAPSLSRYTIQLSEEAG